MPSWRHTLTVARRRSAAYAALISAAATLPVVSVAVLIWAAFARARESPVNWSVVVFGVGLCVVAGAVVGFLRRPSALSVAATLDKQAGTHDAIATALQLSAKPVPTPLEARAISDADAAAGVASPADAFPWSIKRPALLTALSAVILTGAAFIPPRWTADLAKIAGLDPGPPRVEVQQALASATAAEQLINAVQPPSTPASTQAADQNTDTQRQDALTELRQQLERGSITPKEATQQVATAIERAADRLDERAAAAQAAHDRLRDRLAMGLKEAGRERESTHEPSSELSRALREGDIDKAAAEAERLADAADKLSAEDRAKLADDLKRLAEDLGKPAPAQREQATQAPQPTPSTQSPSSTPDPEQRPDAEKPAAQAETDKQVRDLSEKIEKASDQLKDPQPQNPDQQRSSEQQDKPDQPEQTRDNKSSTSSGQRQTKSDEAKRQPDDRARQQEGSPRSSDQRQPPDGQRSPEGKPETGSNPQDATQPRPDDKPRPDGNTRQGDQRQPGDKQQPAGVRQDQQGQNESPKPTDTPSSSGKPLPDDQPGAASKPQNQGQTQPDKNEQRQPDTKPAPSAPPPPDARPSPTGQPRSDQAPQGDAPKLDQLRDALKQLAEKPRDAKRDRQDAQNLREQAEKMWENATPQQRSEMEKLAREFAKQHGERGTGDTRSREEQDRPDNTDPAAAPRAEGDLARSNAAGDSTDPAGKGGGPGDQPPGARTAATGIRNERPTNTQDIDAHSTGEAHAPSRVIAEWLTNKPPSREGASVPQPPQDVARAVRQSQQTAEQALQERTVPSRLSPLIRRYFERLPQAVGAQPSAPSSPLPSSAPSPPAPAALPAKP